MLEFIQPEIIKYPNPILRQVATPITQFDETLKKVVGIMFRMMYTRNGVGLSGPQVGLPYQLIVINAGNKEMVFCNIIPISYGDRTKSLKEGCLSVPGVHMEVTRPHRFSFTAQDLEGKTHKYAFEGLTSRVIQHEYDHLIGKLIIDYGDA